MSALKFTTVRTKVLRDLVRNRSSDSSYVLKNDNLWKTLGFIGGKWTTGQSSLGTFDVRNPATGDVIAQCARMSAADVTMSAEVSHQAWKLWKNSKVTDRAKILRRMSELMSRHSDDLAYIITLESGKPFAEAKGEINYARSFYDYYAEEATRINGEMMESSFTLKLPVGPAALITPWNFPSASKFYDHCDFCDNFDANPQMSQVNKKKFIPFIAPLQFD
jgi:succinate-semialdehyde dehydrogenase / glutarate-semialdehyde dehydrogenase